MALRSDAKFHFFASLQSLNSCFWFCAKLNGCLPQRHLIDFDLLRLRSPGSEFSEMSGFRANTNLCKNKSVGGDVHLGSERPVERECCTPQFLPAGCYRG